LTDLLAAARQHGLTARDLAVRLGVGVSLVVKLQQRLIRCSTLPDLLITRLAEILDTGADALRGYLQQRPTLASGASYKSPRQVPQASRQESFLEALDACHDLTPEQKQAWRNEVGAAKDEE
jgi:transcriptional regulator with XRE-family HTH domain